MAILRESPWYEEIYQEGVVTGQRATLLRLLQRRFGLLPSGLEDGMARLDVDKLDELVDVVLTADSLAEVEAFLDTSLNHGDA